jgi:hypothetical protein
MKMTVLEMVQDILSAIEADDVNSISDTPEGDQVALIIRDVYFQMLTWATTPELHNAYFNLEGLSDTNQPNYLKLPTNITELYWWKYDIQDTEDTQAVYANVKYLCTEDFFEHVMKRDSSETEVISVTTNDGVDLFIYNDRNPEYYTILNDEFIVCDAYDSAIETTLQGSKTVAAGQQEPTFTLSDSFTPSLDANLFPYLLAEAKAIAFVELKQTESGKHERISREQKIRHQNQRNRFKDLNGGNTNTVNFGRRRR